MSWDSCGSEPARSLTVVLVTWSTYGMQKIRGANRYCQRRPPCLVRLALGEWVSWTTWNQHRLSNKCLKDYCNSRSSDCQRFSDIFPETRSTCVWQFCCLQSTQFGWFTEPRATERTITWLMTSRDLERSRLWPRYISASISQSSLSIEQQYQQSIYRHWPMAHRTVATLNCRWVQPANPGA